MSKISNIHARQILDSRGTPTIEVEVHTEKGTMGRAAVPSGASTGQHEALELRDQEQAYFLGKSVYRAIEHVKLGIQQALLGQSIFEQDAIDQILIHLDGTAHKTNLGANAMLGVSLGVAKAAAQELNMSLYRYLGGVQAHVLPIPMINILNGGIHANNNIDIQEFMIMPVKAACFSEALRMGVEVFYQLGALLQEKGLSTNVGDEGGFAPHVASNEAAIALILQAIEKAHYRPGEDIYIALDAASTEFYDKDHQYYYFSKSSGRKLSAVELIDFWHDWVKKYPILSIEDGMAENDWSGWRALTHRLGKEVQLVGDDLFVTDVSRLQKGIDDHIANAVIVKMNQVGTLSETLATVRLAEKYGYNNIVSHRSGETEDCTIADLAVAWNTGQIKSGSVARTDRTAKYNQLIRIEEELGAKACFAGKLFKRESFIKA